VNGIPPRVPYVLYSLVVGATAWVLSAMSKRTGTNPEVRWIALWLVTVATGAVVLAFVSTGRGTPFGDFDKAYYPAGQAALSEPARLYDCGHADGLCFVNVPAVALAFVPMSAMPLGAAHAAMTAIGLASVALSIFLLMRLVGTSGVNRFLIASLVLLNGPLFYSLRLANLTHVVLVLLVASLLALRDQRTVVAGGLLALCALLKPPFLLWLPYLLLRRRSRPAAVSFVVALACVGGLSLWWFGADLHRAWFAQFVGGASSRPIGAYNAQSISGMLVRLTTSAHLVDWVGVEVGTGIRLAGLALTGVVFGTAAVALWPGRPAPGLSDHIAEYSIVICVMLLVSPVSWTHYYCYLLVPLSAWAAGRFNGTAKPIKCFLAAGALLVSLPVALWIPGGALIGPVVARVLLSHYVGGAALLLVGLVFLRIRSRETAAAGLVAA
jgi:hypothetical protein